MRFEPDTIQPLLKMVADTTHALTADLLAVDGAIPLVSWGSAASVGIRGTGITTVRDTIRAVTAKAAEQHDETFTAEATAIGYRFIAAAVRHHDFRGGVCLMGRVDDPWSDHDRVALAMAARMCSSVLEVGSIEAPHRRLDSLVTYVASELMGVQKTDMSETTFRILGELGRFFGADHVCIRKNDSMLRATVLAEEWPRRPDVPEPDPLGVVPWDTDDPIFAMTPNLREPFVMRPTDGYEKYQNLVKEGAGVEEVSLATVPLMAGESTLGALSLNHFSDRIWTRPEVGALQAIAALFVQLDQRVTAEANLHYQAYHDELTGLWNRRAFIENLTKVLVADPSAPLAVLFADMDRLKTVNDVLGHAVGDMFIQAVARRLREAVRAEDVVARLAGDEFVIVLHGIETASAAERAARRILDRVSEPLDVGGHAVSRSASIGLSVNGDQASTVDELLGNADVALLEAKDRGGDAVVAFRSELRARILERADLELRLRTAISDNEMRLYFQPEFNLRNGRIMAVEALVRWQHPDRGLLPAGAFVSVAEEINMAAELGRWVLEEACRQLSVWKMTSPMPPPAVRVNVSAGELISADFLQFVESMLNRYDLDPAELTIEITESTVMREVDDVLITLKGLRDLGVTLAIDDFGTGYSSLAQLKQLPVDILKIDRSFVSTLADDSGNREIVAAVVRLAEAFNLTTVAEGVEDVRAITALLQLGCYRAQGFLMSRPLPAHEVLAKAVDNVFTSGLATHG